MARVRFYLKRPKAETPQSLFALYHVSGQQVKIYLPISVKPTDWSKKAQRVKSSAFNAVLVNDRLSEIQREIEKTAFRLDQAGELTPEALRAELAGGDVSPTAESRSALDQVDAWIDEAGTTRRPRTVKIYATMQNHLNQFCSIADRNPALMSIDVEFVRGFARYLTEDVGLQNSSRWNMLKTLKTFLGWAFERELTRSRTFEKIRKKDFQVVEPDIVRLTEDELDVLTAVDLSDDTAIENARDLFVLQCHLGVRYGDLARITPAQIDGEFLRLTTEKNRKNVSIPILPEARALIEREHPPRPISNQKYNKYIKQAAKRAGIDTPVVTSEYRGNERMDETHPKHELISTHTAKRTFVSMMIARGVSVETIMKVTGNARSTIDRYIALDETDILSQFGIGNNEES